MFTTFEKRTLNLVYSIACKFPTIPYTRKDGEIILKVNIGVKYCNYFTWTLLFATLGLQTLHFPKMTQDKSLSMLVLHGSSFVGYLVLVITKLNIWIYKSEMVHLINQVFYMNATWGMIF